jgi:propionyl-CoA carboxylase alpha chain
MALKRLAFFGCEPKTMSRISINKILIANRGEIARRIMRTCRAMGIATVAVCSDPDREALFVHESDEVVPLEGLPPGQAYLDIPAIIDAARKTGCDAIHPGYGFLSENPALARACQDSGIAFIGPPAEVIEAMGSKIEAKRRLQAASVPLLPSVDAGNQSAERVLRLAESLGWPLIIKASAGGGGRGMRIARQAADFAELLETARRESQAAFGDSALFVEPYVEKARHIEIQIFGDVHGNLLHLFERECSIQRRHQKVIEESPSVALDEELRRSMTAAALRVGKAVGYVNAGTVEFLLTPDKQFYFLEVNTRLQVEHGVTECVTGLDLVRLQILVAAGAPLPPEAREATLHGHAIEARLCAEDPRHDYLPSAGTVHRFRIAESEGLRVDSAIGESGIISPFYDSLLAKVIAYAPSRSEAARRLGHALARAQIHGVNTNRDLLVRTLAHPEFQQGQTDTHFLTRHDPAVLAVPLADANAEKLHAAAAALAGQQQRRQSAQVLRDAPSGWRNNRSQMQRTRFLGSHDEITVEYGFERGALQLRVDDQPQQSASCECAGPERIQLQVAGIARSYDVHRVGDTYFVDSPLGASILEELPRFAAPRDEAAAGSLVAPLPGVVNEVKVKQDDTVAAGDVLLVIDSMKVFHWISAPLSGRVMEIRVSAGDQVEAGVVLVVIEPS